jgi:LmbE family N-acetylglucosaminyl deacetylase
MDKINPFKVKITTTIGFVLVVLPITQWLLWIHCYNSQNNHAARLEMYHNYFPAFLNGQYSISILSIFICVVGIILSLIYWKKNGLFFKVLAILSVFIGIPVITISSFSFFKENNIINYARYKSAQDYNVPLFDKSEKNKTALFIFPHADDEIACAGTILQLKESGWTIDLLTLTKGQLNEKNVRTNEWKNAVSILHIDNYEILDLPNNSWDNVQKNEIEFWLDHQDSIENIIYNTIQKYKPTYVFTFDTVFGGYGHPEHRISALAVYNVFQKHKRDSLLYVEGIFQLTLPKELAQLVFGNELYYYNSFKNEMNSSGNKTLPDPTIAFDISNSWTTKRKAALAHVSQYPALKLFLPKPADTTIHYKTFDREYYSEIKR